MRRRSLPKRSTTADGTRPSELRPQRASATNGVTTLSDVLTALQHGQSPVVKVVCINTEKALSSNAGTAEARDLKGLVAAIDREFVTSAKKIREF